MKIYFAHQISLYGTGAERDIVALLEKHFKNAQITNPGTPEHQDACDTIKKAGGEVMRDYFLPLMDSHDAGVFTVFLNGKAGKGVYDEVARLLAQGKPVFFLNPFTLRLEPTPSLKGVDCMTVGETRAQLQKEMRLRQSRVSPYASAEALQGWMRKYPPADARFAPEGFLAKRPQSSPEKPATRAKPPAPGG